MSMMTKINTKHIICRRSVFEFHAAFLNVKRQVEYNPMVRPYILYFPIRVHIQIYILTYEPEYSSSK